MSGSSLPIPALLKPAGATRPRAARQARAGCAREGSPWHEEPAITSLATATRPPDRVGLGIGLTLLSFSLFATSDMLSKLLIERYPVGEIAGLSACFSLLPVTLMVARGGDWGALRPRRPLLVALRAALAAASTMLFYFAIRGLPLADAYALVFTGPLWVTALSVPLLGETVGWRRWTAVAVGFAGVLVALRPGFGGFAFGQLAALTAAFTFSLSLIVLRRLGHGESSPALIASLLLAMLVISIPGMLSAFRPPAPLDLAMIAVNGLLIGTAHIGLVLAFRQAPPSIIAPFQFSQMIWGVLFGLLVFGNAPDGPSMVGAAIIIASGLYTLWREAARRGRAAA
jgi:drug/metabolite transporter (DMT)-like permease